MFRYAEDRQLVDSWRNSMFLRSFAGSNGGVGILSDIHTFLNQRSSVYQQILANSVPWKDKVCDEMTYQDRVAVYHS